MRAAAHLILSACATRAGDADSARRHIASRSRSIQANALAHYAAAELAEAAGDVAGRDRASRAGDRRTRVRRRASTARHPAWRARGGAACADAFSRVVALDPRERARLQQPRQCACARSAARGGAGGVRARRVAQARLRARVANVAVTWRDAGEMRARGGLLRAALARRTGKPPLRAHRRALAGLLRERGALDESRAALRAGHRDGARRERRGMVQSRTRIRRARRADPRLRRLSALVRARSIRPSRRDRVTPVAADDLRERRRSRARPRPLRRGARRTAPNRRRAGSRPDAHRGARRHALDELLPRLPGPRRSRVAGVVRIVRRDDDRAAARRTGARHCRCAAGTGVACASALRRRSFMSARPAAIFGAGSPTSIASASKCSSTTSTPDRTTSPAKSPRARTTSPNSAAAGRGPPSSRRSFVTTGSTSWSTRSSAWTTRRSRSRHCGSRPVSLRAGGIR